MRNMSEKERIFLLEKHVGNRSCIYEPFSQGKMPSKHVENPAEKCRGLPWEKRSTKARKMSRKKCQEKWVEKEAVFLTVFGRFSGGKIHGKYAIFLEESSG